MARGRYDDDEGLPTGVSFLLFFLAVVALCISVVYLQASTRHDREIKISAYEETVSEWLSFRSTFSRLSLNVTAHFGVAPVNSTDPGLDPDPPLAGTAVSLTVSEEKDPIEDEEGDAGGLPDYNPLKFDWGVAPPPWRIAPRYPPPDDPPAAAGDDASEDSEDHPEESSGDSPQQGSATAEGDDDGSADGGEEGPEDGDGKDSGGADESGNGDDDGDGDGGNGRSRRRRNRRKRRRLENEEVEQKERSQDQWSGQQQEQGEETLKRTRDRVSRSPPSPPRKAGKLKAVRTRSRQRRLEGEDSSEAESETEMEEDQDDSGREAFPPDFIPAVSFEDAPSVRFVLSARLDPPAASRNGNSNGNGNGNRNRSNSSSSGSRSGKKVRTRGQDDNNRERRTTDDRNRSASKKTYEERKRRRKGAHATRIFRERNRSRGKANDAADDVFGINDRGSGLPRQRRLWGRSGGKNASASNRGGGKGGSKGVGGTARDPAFATMTTEWTPLTRIREEHAPMPAPETKCMQVFGGVHNYKTKMCEVFERLSSVCVQVYVNEAKGDIYFAPVSEPNHENTDSADDNGDDAAVSNGEDGEDGEREAAATAAARYGCDPRTAWSPWRYTVLPVEGRTVLDVVPPPSISFVETLFTVRSDLDPFLHAEALTFTPGSGYVVGDDGSAGDIGSGIGDNAGSSDVVVGGGDSPGESGVAAGGSGGGGEGFLKFGLSSRSSAVVGLAFLAVGLLLLVQPVLAFRGWWKRSGEGGGMGGEGSGRGRRGEGGGFGGRGRKGRGQWRYGQVETDWAEESDLSDGELFEQRADSWGSEGDWQGQHSNGSVGGPPSPMDEDQTARDGDFGRDSLRRRSTADSVTPRGDDLDEEGVELGPLTRASLGSAGVEGEPGGGSKASGMGATYI